MGKLKNLFKGINTSSVAKAELLLYNDAVTLVHDATKICWDKPPAKTYKEKKEFIRKRIATGHESILEHSNIVMLITISEDYLIQYNLLDFHYLNIVFTPDDKEEKLYHILVGGSIRGYKHLFRNNFDRNNKVALLIANVLYSITPREFWVDLIDDYILKDKFVDIMTDYNIQYLYTKEFIDGQEIDENTENYSELHSIKVSGNDPIIAIPNMDDLMILRKKLENYPFYISDMLEMCTVTIVFKHMSRVITQQLIRHRNGVTQASGRYIDLTGAVFNSPAKFKEKYKDQKYDICIFGKAFNGITMDVLGTELLTIYKQLRDQGVDKEDARGFLPQNTQCGDVYMTFTYGHLIKFLQLRTHTSAQVEIRKYANKIYDTLIDILKHKLDTDNIYSYLEPYYKFGETNCMDSSCEEVIDTFTEEIKEENHNE